MPILPKWATLDRNDVLVMLLIFPATFLCNYLLLGEAYFVNSSMFWLVTGLTATSSFIFGNVMGFWMKFLRIRFPEFGQSTRRLVYSGLFYMVALVALILLMFDIYARLGYTPNTEGLRWVLLISFLTNVLATGLHEAFYYHRRWQASVVTELRLRDVSQRQQLEVLKQQINPHFLFNSLNILDALIEDEPAQARTFLNELATVYRYLLRSNELSLAPLSTELDFIRSYFNLLKTRHGHSLHLELRVHERFEKYQLPPLTLQLLVENAVKHNVVLPEQPLTIEIQTSENGQLIVKNTLQRKKRRVLSNGVGLSNILSQYQMLGQPAPIVGETDGQFVVQVPLIEPV